MGEIEHIDERGGTPNPCPICCRGTGYSHSWSVCFKTEQAGYFKHEIFVFGPGSILTEQNAETWARNWAENSLRKFFPFAVLRAIVRESHEMARAAGPDASQTRR